MAGSLRPVAGLIVGLGSLIVARQALAACPGDCPIPGGTSKKTECLVEYSGATFNSPPTKPKNIVCTDGDPTCDADGVANGACRLDLTVCLNNADPRFPDCSTATINTYTVSNGKVGSKRFDPQLEALRAAVQGLLPTSSTVCSSPQTITIPLKVSKTIFKKGKKKVSSKGITSLNVKDSDTINYTCMPSTALPGPAATYSRAAVITQPAQLIEGPLARGQLGDILLDNDKIQVVIQKPGRVMFGIGTYGGNIIDADRQRADGLEHDNFEELAPSINIENTADYTNVTVLNDGTNGQPAVVRATGPDDLLDFINPSSVVQGFGFTFPAGADDTDLPVDVQTDYTLQPGKDYVKIDTTITNTSAAPVSFYFGEFVNGSGQPELFQPVYGFGEPLVTDPPCPASTYQTCTAGTCDVCNFLAYSGDDTAAGVSYGYVHTANGTTTFSTSGVSVMLLGERALTVLVGAAPANFHLTASGNPGDAVTISRYFVVGDGTVASIEDARNEIQGIATTGTLQGTVTSGGLPLADADVAVLGTPVPSGPSRNVVDHFRTDANGHYSGTIAAGTYTVEANKDGRLFGTPSAPSVNVAAGGTITQDFTMPDSGHMRVTVTDENNNPIPAKVQLVGFDPSPDPLNTQNIGGGLVVNNTGVFGEQFKDGLSYGIAFVTFAPRTGDTGVVDIEPGTYQLVVSHGPRYSAFFQNVTINAGATTTVAAQIARVVDTPGWIDADFHVHSIESPDSQIPLEQRVATMLAEGMDFFTPSDHDYRTDYGPTIASMGVSDLISTAQSAEITTFDYGHYNSWPVSYDPNAVNHGGIDWGRAGIAPGMDFPAYGSYNLTPAEIFAAAHADTPGNLIQINHVASFFGADGLDIDTAEGGTGPAQSHTPGSKRRLDPSVPNYFDSGFDALEVWIGTDGRSGDLNTFVGLNLGDWFNLLNQGILRPGTADSDTHHARTTEMNARNWIPSAVTTPALIGGNALTIANTIKTGHSVGSNAAFVRISANAPSTAQTASLDLGSPTMVSTSDGDVDVTVTIKAPIWDEFDKVEFYLNNAPQAYDHDGKPSTRKRYRVFPNFVKNAGTDFTITTVNDYPSIPGASHNEATVTLNLTGLTQDAWLVALVRGTDGVSHPLFPVLPNSLNQAGNTTLANLTDGNLNEGGILALSFTNPLYIDANNDSVWTPPGVMLTP